VLGDILGELFVAKGLARSQAVGELEAAWAEVLGPAAARQTQVAGLRHGVLTIYVAHPALLEELAAFRKPALLDALRRALPATRLTDLRFRVGPVDAAEPESKPAGAEDSRPAPLPHDGKRPR
jgi:predicted nucleic acid-binding Zn ribbon protein